LNPLISIKSRYSQVVSSNSYQYLSFSGVSSALTMATLTTGGTYSQGYIWAPYIMMVTGVTTIWNDPEYNRRIIRKSRKEKLEKIWDGIK
jgi:hypothetical protein